jgi:hypothetical protein
MQLGYGAANGNGREAARIYGERFPNRQHLYHIIQHTYFGAINRRLRERGKFVWSMTDAGRDRTIRTVASEGNILDAVNTNPRTGVLTVAHELGTSASTTLTLF